MLSDEEKKALERIDYIQDFIIENGQYNADVNDMEYFSRIKNLIEKQFKETLKCTQNSWYEDTIKIEEMKKQIDLENADKKWEDKIKAKIEEVKDGTYDAKIVLQSLLEKE